MPNITSPDGTPLTQADADRANATFCSLPGRARRRLEEALATDEIVMEPALAALLLKAVSGDDATE